jgi:endoglycosylceramidase
MKELDLIFFIYFYLFITYCDGSANVHVANSLIVDDSGRVRIYHGANFVFKEFPWYPAELLDPNYVANLSQWGLNFVRLGYEYYFLIFILLSSINYFRMMWSGVEPQRQKYNLTYLNVMKNIVELLESNNIFVLLDMHQDVLSSRTGTYDGIPAWLYDRFPPSAHPCNKIFFYCLDFRFFFIRSLAT